MKNIFKKMISALLATVTAVTGTGLGSLAANVSAAESWVAGNGAVITVESYPFGYHFAGSGLGGFWADCIPKLSVDGQVAYCIDSLSTQGPNGTSSGRIGDSYTAENQISLALAYGYTSKTKYGYSADTERLATQIVIWNMLDGWYDNGSETTALNYFTAEMGDSTLIANVKTVYYKIKENIKNYKVLPSFNSNREREMTYNSSTKKWTLTLTDTKGVADQFDWAGAIKGKSYLSVDVKAGSVTFTSTKEFDTITLNAPYNNKYFTAVKGVPVVPLAGQSCEQPVVTYRSADPFNASVKLYAETATGSCQLIKTSEDGRIEGIGFRVYKPNGTILGTYYTDSYGTFTVDNLEPGTYTVSEIPQSGYVKQESQTVTINAGETARVVFSNNLLKGSLKLIKTALDGKVSGISFEIYAKSGVVGVADGTKIGTYTTNDKGEILIPDLKVGTYTVTEIVPEGYKPQSSKDVTITSDNTSDNPAVVRFYNEPTNTGAVEIVKTSDDNRVGNIKFTIATKDGKLIGVYTTKTEVRSTGVVGVITTKLVAGEYVITEKTSPLYEEQPPQTVTVKEGETTEVKFHNTLIPEPKGSIQLTKVNESNHDELLSGAEFSVSFSVKAGMIKIPIGNMEEISEGVYYFGNLQEGVYYITETKAPEGYELDTNTYSVKVTDTKKTYIVTNSDDETFTNHSNPQITTLAASQSGGNAFAAGKVTIDDTVSYKNLIVGKTYTVKGVLMTPSFDWDKRETGVPFLVGGKQVTAEKTFTAASSNGNITLSFTFDTSEITQNTKVVVFEEVYVEGSDNPIASHKDINDRDQTVEIHKARITTSATSYNRKDVIGIGTITIDDSVEYNDLIVGEQYTVKGVLMDKSTGKAFTVNGKTIESQTTFTATATEGTVAVRFTFNASDVAATTKVVAYERLYYGGTEIAAHTDINDSSQTVEILKPQISTTATSMNEKHAFGIGNVTIDDAVAYSNLIEEQEYTLVGVLMDKTTGKAFTVNGKAVEARTTFTAKSSSGTVAVRFAFDASGITANTQLVVYETLYRSGTEIANHKDINDAGQTVEIHKPSISTTATSNGEKETIAVGSVTINDVVTYKDLIVGKEYTINGTLMDKLTAAPFTVNGKEVTAQAKFTPTAANGRITVTFTFDASGITKNTKLVAFETLYYNGVELTDHKEINDAGQTVELHKPKLSTTATVDGGKEAIAVGTVTVDDVVYYSDLVVGKKYTVTGTLMDKSTAAPFTVNGKEITAQAEFTPTTASGSVTVKFTFDASGITKNTKLVAYERLYLNGIEIAVHTNINDTAQTVELKKPQISTVATSNGEKEVIAVGTVTIDDVVSYSNLIIGKEYTLSGVLMDKATGTPFMINNKTVTAEAKFTPTTTSGTAAVKFTFDGSKVTANTVLVVYERLYLGGTEIAKHTDLNDKDQTVEAHKPSIGTIATSNGEKETIGVGTVTINDTVAYHDLIVGKEYTVSGVLMNKATGKPFTVNGKEVTSSVKFTAKAADETVTVSFVFNADSITQNTKLVVFETLYLGGVAIAVHADINDAGQTVELHKPSIGTTATSGGEKEVIAVGTVTIDDVISYKDMIVGKEYVVNGVLMNKATGKPFTVNGKEITAQAKFTPTASNGTVTVKFTFDGSAITANTKLVAYERLYLKDVEIAVHTDINDQAQTVEVHKPSIGTTATSNGEKETIAVGNITVVDTVAYHDLIVGKEYTVVGILMNRATGKAFTINSEEVTSTVKFTPTAANAAVSVSFTFDGSAITENTKLVAFQTLYLNGVEIANHKDINDAGQTVEIHKPSIGTSATSKGEKETIAVGTVTINDVVSYKDLIIGKEYTVNGVLMNKATGKPFTVNGKEITSQVKFTPATTNGSIGVSFTFDASGITANTKLVAYERLSLGNVEIAVHTDINDAAQTVELHKPSIGTTATSNGEKEAIAVGTVTIDDVVSYKDLIVGKEYILNGVLMNKTTGKPFTVNGKEVTAQVKFTPTTTNGTVTVKFTFDGSAITANTKLVAYERLSLGNVEIAVHTDINDSAQTVELHKPEIGTNATSNGEKEAIAVGTITIDDVVSYKDLIVGKEYILNGVLMNKTTGKPFTVNGNEVTARVKFTPTTTNGTVTVSFTFDASGITANTKLVAYERLSLGNVEIAVHTDINDAAQTVELHKPSIGTTATSNGEKEAIAVGTVTIDDVVSYKDLIIGKEYTLNGVLMNKTTGKPFAVNGKEVTAQVKFTPTTTNGTVTVSFTFDASGITANTKIVAYERLFLGNVEIAVHTDINDAAQTVELHKPVIGTFATSDGEKETIAVGNITVIDTVDYHDLIVGKEYVVIGILMDKTTGMPFTVNGKEITSQNTFTAVATDEFVTVSFSFDGNAITENTKLVAFQTLYLNGVEIANHKDIADEGQTVEVHKPEIGTAAAVNGEKEVIAVGTITIDDVVFYKDLIIGKEYTVNGVLMNKTTGQPFTVNGKEITAQTKFTAETTDGEVNVTFTFDSSEITENTKLVVFESLYYKEVEIASHNDIDDEGQTIEVHKPEIGTTADSNGEKEAFAVGTVTINDIVKYHDLIVGKEYVVNGVLMNKETNEPFLVDGEKVTAQTTFVAETTDGEVTVTFVFDASGITENMTVVAFETMSLDGVEFVVHADIEDEEQTVYLKKPKISTVATINGEKDAFAVSETVIKDVIAYQDLIVGKEYTILGVLMNQATSEAFLVNGEPVTTKTVFIANSENGEVEASFIFDVRAITDNTKLVVFETMYFEDTELTTHTDIDDENQTVTVHKPSIGTTAASNGEKEVIAVGEISINDVVAYHDLIVGKEYVVKGILMNQATGEAFLVNGEPVTAEAAFIAESEEETVIVTFTFDSSAITENTKLVVFETLYLDGETVASHEDIDDEGQTVEVRKPEIGTSASSDGEKEAVAIGIVTIEDIVKYHDLIIGKKYVVNGILMNKATGEPFLIDGKEVTAQTTFVAETVDGEITVIFEFDASSITENMTVVAFETMSYDGIEFAVHADIDDEEQTVKLVKPEIGTKASSNYIVDGDKFFIVVDDVIAFKNLITGKEYTIKGVLMDKLTGQPYLVNGKQITVEKTFIPEEADGEITVRFTIDATGFTKAIEVVVFETIYLGEEKIAAHTDITDVDQTVRLIPIDEDVPLSGNPPTGVGFEMGMIGAFGLAAVAVVVFGKRRKK